MGTISGLYGINPDAREVKKVRPFMNHAQKVRNGLGIDDRAWKNRQDDGSFVKRKQPKQLADHIRGSIDRNGNRKYGLNDNSFDKLLDELLDESGLDGRRNYVTCVVPEERKPRRIKTKADERTIAHYKKVDRVSKSNKLKTEARWKSLGYSSYREYADAEIHKY